MSDSEAPPTRKRSRFDADGDKTAADGGDANNGNGDAAGADRARALAAKFAKLEEQKADAGAGGSRVAAPSDEARELRKKVYVPKTDEDINFIGLLLGPRGSTLKGIQETSGCKVMIRGRGSTKDGVGEDDEDLHVLLQGKQEDELRKAEELVRNILFDPAHAAKLKANQLSNLNGRPGATLEDPSIKTTELTVKKQVAGSIIGRGGEVIRDLKDRTGASINVNDSANPDDQTCTVLIRGSEESVKLAEELVNNIVNDSEQKFAERMNRRQESFQSQSSWGGAGQDDRQRFEISVPEDRVGLVIGSRGATIKALQHRFNARINVTQPHENSENPSMRLVIISAADQAVFQACNEEIQRIIANQQGGGGGGGGSGGGGGGPSHHPGGSTHHFGGGPPGQREMYQVPQDKIGLVIGKGGSVIKGIQTLTGCKLQVQQQMPGEFMRMVELDGSDQQRMAAKQEIDGVIASYAAGTYKQYQERFQMGGWGAANSPAYGSQPMYGHQQQQQQYGQQQQWQQAYGYYGHQQNQQPQQQQQQQQQQQAPGGGPQQQQKYTRKQWKAWRDYYSKIPGMENKMAESPPPDLLLEDPSEDK